MRIFKCDGCYEKCCVTIQFGANPPRHCHHDDNISNWCEVKEEPTTKSSQLPKLTAEVFRRPDCPKNVQYAVVTSEGRVIGYTSKPYINTFYNIYNELTQCWAFDAGCSFTISVAGTFDSSDWQNSLIERPVKTLPDWCKGGEWAYDSVLREYGRINKEDDFGWYIDNIESGRVKQAHKRPFSAEEMQGMVGKMLDVASGIELIVGYNKCTKEIITYDDTYSAERLMGATGWRIDGKPCYVLEHLNDKGEWVK